VQLLARQAVDGADGAPECIEEAVTWIMARMRRRQLVARAGAVHEFLAGLYGGGACLVGAMRARSKLDLTVGLSELILWSCVRRALGR
jgi:hypothetical protein